MCQSDCLHGLFNYVRFDDTVDGDSKREHQLKC